MIRAILRRLHDERDRVFVADKRDRSRVPYETRELIVSLSRALPSYGAVARELNRLGVTTAYGKQWTGSAVSATLAVHERARKLVLPDAPDEPLRKGRPNHLPESLRADIWRMHRVEKKTLKQIAEWLQQRGIKTASGKEHWDQSTVLYIVRTIDRRNAATAAEAAA